MARTFIVLDSFMSWLQRFAFRNNLWTLLGLESGRFYSENVVFGV